MLTRRAVTGSAGVTQWLNWNTGASGGAAVHVARRRALEVAGPRNVNGVSSTSPVNALGSVGGAAPFSSDTCSRVPASIICCSVGSGAGRVDREQLRLQPGVRQHARGSRRAARSPRSPSPGPRGVRVEERAHDAASRRPCAPRRARRTRGTGTRRTACPPAARPAGGGAAGRRGTTGAGSSAALPSGPERSVYTRPPRGVPKYASIWKPRIPCSSCACIERRWFGGTKPVGRRRHRVVRGRERRRHRGCGRTAGARRCTAVVGPARRRAGRARPEPAHTQRRRPPACSTAAQLGGSSSSRR